MQNMMADDSFGVDGILPPAAEKARRLMNRGDARPIESWFSLQPIWHAVRVTRRLV